MQKLAEIVVHETIKMLFHFDMNSGHKSCLLPPLEWSIKGCTHTHTHTHTHTRAHTYTHHTNVHFLLQFAFAGYAKCQMSKESLIVLGVLFYALTKLKQYEQFPKNCNSSFKMYCAFVA